MSKNFVKEYMRMKFKVLIEGEGYLKDGMRCLKREQLMKFLCEKIMEKYKEKRR